MCQLKLQSHLQKNTAFTRTSPCTFFKKQHEGFYKQ